MELQQKLFIPFFTAGFPELTSTTHIIEMLDDLGADYIEVGLPHSDALADGPVIQEASYRALQNGMHAEKLIEQVSGCRVQRAKLLLFSYFNPLLAHGLEKAARDWRQAGGSCLLVPDLPLEEAEQLYKICREEGLALIFLLAPTSTEERIKKIIGLSDEFIYLVSVTGVTGTRQEVAQSVGTKIAQIKRYGCELPIALGFGIGDVSTAKQALEQGADGIVVGSALSKLLASSDFAGVQDLCRNLRAVCVEKL